MRALLLGLVVALAGCVVERCEWTPDTDATELDDAGGAGGDESTPAPLEPDLEPSLTR